MNTKSKGPKNVLMSMTMKPTEAVTKDDGREKLALYKLYNYNYKGRD